MIRSLLLRILAAIVVLAGCGGSADEPPPAAAPTNGVATTSAAGTTNPKARPSGAASPFDLSVLGPSWNVAAQPFEPAPERPSDCPEFDRLKADFRAWATTQRVYRVDGLLIFEVNAEAPDAATAASFLDRQSSFMIGCYPVRYPSGGVTRIEPASSRKNQTMYTVRHDDFDEQTTIFTIKDAWVIEVTVFDASTARVIGEIIDTLLDQARA